MRFLLGCHEQIELATTCNKNEQQDAKNLCWFIDQMDVDMGNHEERHDSPRSCRMRFVRSVRGYIRLDKIRNEVISKERDLWNTTRETQIQTKLDQPPWKNGQHQTPETRPQLQTSRKKRPWTPRETMAMRRCRNRSNDLIHGGWWWWWWWWT